MALLDQSTREQLGTIFGGLDRDVTLEYYTRRASALVLPDQPDACPTCADGEELLVELAELSDKIKLEVHDLRSEPEAAIAAGVERVPTIALRGPDTKGQVRFLGVPAGYEFSSLIGGILDVSTNASGLSERTRTELAGLSEPVHIQVFVTPT